MCTAHRRSAHCFAASKTSVTMPMVDDLEPFRPQTRGETVYLTLVSALACRCGGDVRELSHVFFGACECQSLFNFAIKRVTFPSFRRSFGRGLYGIATHRVSHKIWYTPVSKGPRQNIETGLLSKKKEATSPVPHRTPGMKRWDLGMYTH